MQPTMHPELAMSLPKSPSFERLLSLLRAYPLLVHLLISYGHYLANRPASRCPSRSDRLASRIQAEFAQQPKSDLTNSVVCVILDIFYSHTQCKCN